MRFYNSFGDAFNEIERDLAELGVKVHTESWQGKDVREVEGFSTLELVNYAYTVSVPQSLGVLDQAINPTQPWADVEFQERISPDHINPGQAFHLRPEVWNPHLKHDDDPRTTRAHYFDYTYNERLQQLPQLIELLRAEPLTRRAYLPIYWEDDVGLFGKRVPCSLGYHFMYRQDALNITYTMRSADFLTHFRNDVYLACRMLHHVAHEVDLPVGSFTHFINSLHVFEKDVAGVF